MNTDPCFLNRTELNCTGLHSALISFVLRGVAKIFYSNFDIYKNKNKSDTSKMEEKNNYRKSDGVSERLVLWSVSGIII